MGQSKKYRYFVLIGVVLTALLLVTLNPLESGTFLSNEVVLQPQYSNYGTPKMPQRERFVDFLSEEEALKYPPCQDLDALDLSIQSDYEGGQEYSVGDKFYIWFNLLDGYGSLRKGGDKMFVSIQTEELKAYSSAMVVDLNNGSYVAEIEVLWKGEAKVIIWLYSLREEITCMYRLVRDMLSTRYPVAKYEGIKTSEEYICHVFPDKLQRLNNYTHLCNFTYLNSGFPWYCGHPNKLLCEDWHYVTIRNPPDEDFPLSACERNIFRNNALKNTVTKEYTIYGRSNAATVIQTSSKPCSSYDIERLWYKESPVGFFYNSTWKIRHCKVITWKEIKRCLQNKRLYIFGDSTTRQWFLNIVNRFNCTLVSDLSNPKAHKPMKCVNTELNYTAMWSMHSQPFCTGSNHFERKSYTLYSIARRLDEMNDAEDSIILIHMFSHMVYHHHSILAMKAKVIRNSVERLLKRNKKAKILIKMVHTHQKSDAYFGFTFTNTWYNVFKGLHDKVVFLDNKDATVATRNTELHPDDLIVSAMVTQMFSYACPV